MANVDDFSSGVVVNFIGAVREKSGDGTRSLGWLIHFGLVTTVGTVFDNQHLIPWVVGYVESGRVFPAVRLFGELLTVAMYCCPVDADCFAEDHLLHKCQVAW